MMQGVEILSTATTYEKEIVVWVWLIYLGIVLLFGLVCAKIAYISKSKVDAVISGLLASVLAAMILALPTIFLSVQPTDEIAYYTHKVTIDETVNMKEFLDKYVIIDQEGEIIQVREYIN